MEEKHLDSQSQDRRMKDIFDLMSDKAFTSNHMPFLEDEGHVVLGSFSEAIYALRAEIDVKELLENGLRSALELVPHYKAGRGYAFVSSVTSVIPLPPGYTASRYMPELDKMVFALSGSFPVKVSFGASESRTGGSLIIFGVLGQDDLDQRAAFDAALSYANDVLTSYRLVRHDHGISPLPARQMPGSFDCYSLSFAGGLVISDPEQLSIHANHTMDIWAKRSLLPEEYQEFLSHLEGLVFSPQVRYLLNLAVSSIDDLCLGQFESAVLNSDRYMELALRLCYLRDPRLPDDKLGRIVSVYSPNPKSSTLLSHLLPVLGLSLTPFIEEWASTSRRLRNAIAHKLDFSVVTPMGAHMAVEYNFALVRLLAHRFHFRKQTAMSGFSATCCTSLRLFGRKRPT
jgi:hypothetical protein